MCSRYSVPVGRKVCAGTWAHTLVGRYVCVHIAAVVFTYHMRPGVCAAKWAPEYVPCAIECNTLATHLPSKYRLFSVLIFRENNKMLAAAIGVHSCVRLPFYRADNKTLMSVQFGPISWKFAVAVFSFHFITVFATVR